MQPGWMSRQISSKEMFWFINIIGVTVNERELVVSDRCLPAEMQSLSDNVLRHPLSKVQQSSTGWRGILEAAVSWACNTFRVACMLQKPLSLIGDGLIRFVRTGSKPASWPVTSHFTETLMELLNLQQHEFLLVTFMSAETVSRTKTCWF